MLAIGYIANEVLLEAPYFLKSRNYADKRYYSFFSVAKTNQIYHFFCFARTPPCFRTVPINPTPEIFADEVDDLLEPGAIWDLAYDF